MKYLLSGLVWSGEQNGILDNGFSSKKNNWIMDRYIISGGRKGLSTTHQYIIALSVVEKANQTTPGHLLTQK